MKTGFIYGYPNKPTKKGYSYHGVDRDCLIQPDPGPFEEYPALPGAKWELLYDVWITMHQWAYEMRKITGDFLPSSDDVTCEDPGPDGKKRYWFLEVDYCSWRSDGLWMFLYFSGQTCHDVFEYGYDRCIYRTVQSDIVYNVTYLMSLNFPAIGSHIRLWRSSNGELPAGSPV